MVWYGKVYTVYDVNSIGINSRKVYIVDYMEFYYQKEA